MLKRQGSRVLRCPVVPEFFRRSETVFGSVFLGDRNNCLGMGLPDILIAEIAEYVASELLWFISRYVAEPVRL